MLQVAETALTAGAEKAVGALGPAAGHTQSRAGDISDGFSGST